MECPTTEKELFVRIATAPMIKNPYAMSSTGSERARKGRAVNDMRLLDVPAVG